MCNFNGESLKRLLKYSPAFSKTGMKIKYLAEDNRDQHSIVIGAVDGNAVKKMINFNSIPHNLIDWHCFFVKTMYIC